MTNDNPLDQTKCDLPFEVIVIYDNGSQVLQQNTSNDLPPSVNVKIRIRNKEDTGTDRHGIISVPRLTAKDWPKRVQLVNSVQTIMSFNLALESNTDEVQKKSSRRLFQMFRPGGCLSIHRDEDGYSYKPSISNELKRKNASGTEDYESNKVIGAFALKKNDFSSSNTDTLKKPITFLGKCKPGGCLDPPFGEDKYTYKPTVEDAKSVQQPVINTNSLHPDIKNTTQDQQINILHHSYPETKILGNTTTLVTYPSTLSSSKLKAKNIQHKKSNLRLHSEQLELSKKLTNEFPEAYFIPPRKEKLKNGKSYDKYDYEEKEDKIKEAYLNKDYILKSQTPSELLSDALTITSQSFDEPLGGLMKQKQVIRELNSTTPFLLKSENLLNNKASKDKINNIITTVSAKGMKIDETTFLQDQSSSINNNTPIMENIFSNMKEIKNVLYKHNSRLNSSIKVSATPETVKDNNYNKNAVPTNNSDFEDKFQSMLYNLNVSNDITTKNSKSSIDQTKTSLDNFEIKELNLIKQQNIFNNDKNTNGKKKDIKQQIRLRSEESNIINSFKGKKSGSLEYEYEKNISGQVINHVITKDDTNNETDHPKLLIESKQRRGDGKSINFDKNTNEQRFKNISERTKLLVQDLEFKENNNREELVNQGMHLTTEQIIDILPSVETENLTKLTSLHSLEKILSLKNSSSVQISPNNIYMNQKDSLLNNESSKSTQLTNEKNKGDKHNEKTKSVDSLENTLSPSLIAGNTSSQKTEIDKINAGFSMTLESQENNYEISSKLDNLGDTDDILVPKMFLLNDLSPNKIKLENHNRSKSQQAFNIASKMKTSNDILESIEAVPQLSQQFADFDSLQYRKFLNYSTSNNESKNFNTLINDSKLVLSNLKTDINIRNKKILSDDKFRKPTNQLTDNNIRSLETLSKTTFLQESDIETSDKKLSLKLNNVKEYKIIDPTREINKSFPESNKNINSKSSIAINFGFHTFTNEKSGYSIGTFDPSISLASCPQDNFFTIKTVLRKNDSEIKIPIDSETNLTMQINPTRQLNGSKKLASNVLNGNTNNKRRDNIREYSSEILINKDKLLQETLKAVYETLMPIEKNIIKLKEEADSLYREQLLLKEILFSKEIKSNRIIPNVITCSCLQREIGLE